MKNAKAVETVKIDRSNAEEIRTRIVMNGGRTLWNVDHVPKKFGNVQIVDGYNYGGRVVIVHEFYDPLRDTRSAVDVYVPLTEGIRMEETLSAIDALKER